MSLREDILQNIEQKWQTIASFEGFNVLDNSRLLVWSSSLFKVDGLFQARITYCGYLNRNDVADLTSYSSCSLSDMFVQDLFLTIKKNNTN